MHQFVSKKSPIRALRREIFSTTWPLDAEISQVSHTLASHKFLSNPAGQYSYVYLTRYVKALSEQLLERPFNQMDILDWGCGKGHVSKLLKDLRPKSVESCDIVSEKEDSAFGQDTPIIQRFGIQVKPLKHEFVLPYENSTFDVLLSVGVLEHVTNDRASLIEIKRILKPGGLFFCFFLPTNLSWTQRLAHWRGNDYHDRFYNERIIKAMASEAGIDLLDFWYRQIFPKNSVPYPRFRLFERMDQFITEKTPLRYFATNIEFVAQNPWIVG